MTQRLGFRARLAGLAGLAAAAALTALLLTTGGISAQVPQSAVSLTGAEEVPAVTTTAKGAFWYSGNATSLDYQLQAQGTALTMAHIHLGAKGTNGPVVAFLFGPNADGVSNLDVTGRITAANLVGPLKDKPFGDLVAAIKAGNTYVNVHSKANPAGEVRAQLPADAPPATTAPVAPRPPATGSGIVPDSGSAWALWALVACLVVSASAMVLLPGRRRA